MNKDGLKERFNEVKNLIVTNSKDAHWAKNALDELVSLKGQLDHEPTIVHVPVEKIERTVKGETFEIHKMKDGTVVYHVYGGYTVVVDSRMNTLNNAILDYMELIESANDMTGEEKVNAELSISAFGYIMSCPIFAFVNAEFTFDMASKIVQFLRETSNELLNEELLDETNADIEMNNRFKDATIALDELKSDINKVVNK